MKKIALGVSVAALLLGATAPAAQAYEGWNSYTTTLPSLVGGATPFTVNVDGPDAVCSMTFGDTTLTAAPWNFTYDPSSASSHNDVQVTQCDGTKDSTYIYTRLAFAVSPQLMTATSAGNYQIAVENMSDEVGATTVVKDSKGVVLQTSHLDPSGTAKLNFKAPNLKGTTTYTVTSTSDSGIVQNSPVIIAKGWLTFEFLGTTPNFTPCSTVTWALDSTKQPANAKTFKKDIIQSLAILSKETGLKFVETTDYQNAQLRYHFDGISSAGLGGTDGDITFTSTGSWVTDKHAGFGAFKPYTKNGMRYSGGPGGRGWLIIHETMHSLGFDHIDYERSVMAPVNGGQHAFTAGDREGLHTIYLSKCTA